VTRRQERRRKERQRPGRPTEGRPGQDPPAVDSLLDAMQDGHEYGSIVSATVAPELDLLGEMVRAVREIEEIRRRACLVYVGNVLMSLPGSGIEPADDLPFAEMVARTESGEEAVDVFLATPGGSAHQVSRFVNALRARFEQVDFLIPSLAMSAGTIFALSGDRIWMTPGACLGPIDPQVPSRDGRFVPAQALLLLVEKLQADGDAAIADGRPVPWSAVRIIDSIDKKELGDAITASHYSVTMATQYLLNYKFKSWERHLKTRTPVTEEEREGTAKEIAEALASHDRWKSHGHAIPREMLRDQVELLIDHPDADLERAMRRLWALCYWVFDKTPALKFIVSRNYRFVRHRRANQEVKA
jgi:hypothetical protein